MNTTSPNDVVGKAAYFEFRKAGWTVQMIFMPDGHTPIGAYVPFTAYRRQISADAPRKSWKTMSAVSEPWHGARPPVADDSANMFGLSRFEFADSGLMNLSSRGWKLYKQPVIVEVTSQDMDDVRVGKTPYKVIARITRSRRVLGFGEELFAQPA